MKREINLLNQLFFEIIVFFIFYFFANNFILINGIKKFVFFFCIGIAIEFFFKSFGFLFNYFGELTKKDKKLMQQYLEIMSIVVSVFSIFILVTISFTIIINIKNIIFDNGDINNVYNYVLLIYIPLLIKSKSKSIIVE